MGSKIQVDGLNKLNLVGEDRREKRSENIYQALQLFLMFPKIVILVFINDNLSHFSIWVCIFA